MTRRDLSVSTLAEVETCESPDSGKAMVVAGPRGLRAVGTVDDYDREPNPS